MWYFDIFVWINVAVVFCFILFAYLIIAPIVSIIIITNINKHRKKGKKS